LVVSNKIWHSQNELNYRINVAINCELCNPRPTFITLHFFVTYKWDQSAILLDDYTRPERLSSDKNSNLLDPFISYDDNKMTLQPKQIKYLIELFLFLFLDLSSIYSIAP
jgi:hypothetical protein